MSHEGGVLGPRRAGPATVFRTQPQRQMQDPPSKLTENFKTPPREHEAKCRALRLGVAGGHTGFPRVRPACGVGGLGRRQMDTSLATGAPPGSAHGSDVEREAAGTAPGSAPQQPEG